jgi:hypothetical protein
MPEARLARNISVIGDQRRVADAPLMSLRGDVTPRGDRVYVGNSQEILVDFTGKAPDVPVSFSVILDHVPTDAMPKSGIKVADWTPGGDSYLAVINEVHDANHVWSRTEVWFMATMAGIQQRWLII